MRKLKFILNYIFKGVDYGTIWYMVLFICSEYIFIYDGVYTDDDREIIFVVAFSTLMSSAAVLIWMWAIYPMYDNTSVRMMRYIKDFKKAYHDEFGGN